MAICICVQWSLWGLPHLGPRRWGFPPARTGTSGIPVPTNIEPWIFLVWASPTVLRLKLPLTAMQPTPLVCRFSIITSFKVLYLSLLLSLIIPHSPYAPVFLLCYSIFVACTFLSFNPVLLFCYSICWFLWLYYLNLLFEFLFNYLNFINLTWACSRVLYL